MASTDTVTVEHLDGWTPVKLPGRTWVPSRLRATFRNEELTIALTLDVRAFEARVRGVSVIATNPGRGITTDRLRRALPLRLMKERALGAAAQPIHTRPGLPPGAFLTNPDDTTAWHTATTTGRPPVTERVQRAADAYMAHVDAGGRAPVIAVRDALGYPANAKGRGRASQLVVRARQAGLLLPEGPTIPWEQTDEAHELAALEQEGHQVPRPGLTRDREDRRLPAD